MKLVIGNKRYSSWSLRPWIALKMANIAFEEEVIPLYQPSSKARILDVSPAGKVPILVDSGAEIWESLAILDYLADAFPEKGLWPKDRKARALARSLSAEMHASFGALREFCPTNFVREPKKRATPAPAGVATDVARIDAAWRDARAKFGDGGPFLFGTFSNADAMFAPVVCRFHGYDLDVSPEAHAYMDAVRATPAWREWIAGAKAEPAAWMLANSELD